ncbi:MAG: hypothetical protein UHD05_08885, partial [Ruminococcus sp.]|nr:hypothetical protein [Ruminococcus sp.]
MRTFVEQNQLSMEIQKKDEKIKEPFSVFPPALPRLRLSFKVTPPLRRPPTPTDIIDGRLFPFIRSGIVAAVSRGQGVSVNFFRHNYYYIM